MRCSMVLSARCEIQQCRWVTQLRAEDWARRVRQSRQLESVIATRLNAYCQPTAHFSTAQLAPARTAREIAPEQTPEPVRPPPGAASLPSAWESAGGLPNAADWARDGQVLWGQPRAQPVHHLHVVHRQVHSRTSQLSSYSYVHQCSLVNLCDGLG